MRSGRSIVHARDIAREAIECEDAISSSASDAAAELVTPGPEH